MRRLGLMAMAVVAVALSLGNLGPPRQEEWQGAVVMNVVSVDVQALTGLYSGGLERFPLASGALSTCLGVGETVTASCRMSGTGAWTVLSVEPHHGLPIAFGTATEVTPERITLETPFGARAFARNADSDVAADVAVGTFVDLKYYRLGDGATILNARTQPGCRVLDGLLASRQPFVLETLRGPVRVAAPAPDLPVGTPLTFRYRLGADGAVEPLGTERRDGGFTFTGKVTERADHTLTVLDTVAHTGLVAAFRSEAVLEPFWPGELVRVTYALPAPPRLVAVERLPLKPVYFGTIQALDAERVRLVTRQGVTRELRVTRDTVIPTPVHPGDMADVIFRGEVATGIFKE